MAAAFAINLSKPAGLVYVPLILAVSFALYYAGFWGAGDGKLYVCCATYLLPSASDGLYAAAGVLFLSVTFCYFAVFIMLLLRGRRENILQSLRAAAKKTFSDETALRLLLSFSVVSAVSLIGFGTGSRFAAFILIYVLSSVLPRAASLAVVLILLLLQFLYPQPIEDMIMLLPAAAFFAFFFAFYSTLAGSYRGGRIAFAPFLLAAAPLIMLLT